ncbi:MAG: ABC transporter ATP-binding protein [Gemmatales bacterium]
MLQATDLKKSFGTRAAVAGVSFDVPHGETFGLLGPNGAGKTTTIHMLAGILRPDAGTISIDGQLDPTRSAVRERLGVAPQSLSLYEELSAEDNLAFFGRCYPMSAQRLKERVVWALEFAGLSDRRLDKVKTFSGGMKRRLNLVCSLIHDPPVVFLDEPTVGVDPQSRNHLLENIETLARQGRTILYTTHYMEEAERLCTRVAIIEQGKILALDTVAGLIDKYGGQAVVEAEIASGTSDSWRTVLDKVLGNGQYQLDANRLRFHADQPLPQANRVADAGLRLDTVRIHRPDLEAVFLKLTGRRLCD